MNFLLDLWKVRQQELYLEKKAIKTKKSQTLAKQILSIKNDMKETMIKEHYNQVRVQFINDYKEWFKQEQSKVWLIKKIEKNIIDISHDIKLGLTKNLVVLENQGRSRLATPKSDAINKKGNLKELRRPSFIFIPPKEKFFNMIINAAEIEY